MFHWPPAIVNALLVQFPRCSVAGISTVAGPVGAVVDVVAPAAAVVAVVAPAAVVAVVAPRRWCRRRGRATGAVGREHEPRARSLRPPSLRSSPRNSR